MLDAISGENPRLIGSRPAPYSPKTLAAMRSRARAGANVAAIARLLNWETERVVRVAQRHSIELFPQMAAALEAHTPTLDTLRLSANARRLLDRLQGQVDDEPVTRARLAQATGLAIEVVRAHLRELKMQLPGAGWQLSSDGGHYWLTLECPAPT